MDIIRKIQYLLFCLLAIGFVACDDDDNNSFSFSLLTAPLFALAALLL